MKRRNEGFGSYVRGLRHALNLTLADVAATIGCTIPYVSDIETGKKNPPEEEKLRKWAKLLNADLEQMQLAAAKHMQSIDLNLTGKSQSYHKAALLLARAPDISEKQMEEIEKIILNRNKKAHAQSYYCEPVVARQNRAQGS